MFQWGSLLLSSIQELHYYDSVLWVNMMDTSAGISQTEILFHKDLGFSHQGNTISFFIINIILGNKYKCICLLFMFQVLCNVYSGSHSVEQKSSHWFMQICPMIKFSYDVNCGVWCFVPCSVAILIIVEQRKLQFPLLLVLVKFAKRPSPYPQIG